jgi:hypothetical protein
MSHKDSKRKIQREMRRIRRHSKEPSQRLDQRQRVVLLEERFSISSRLSMKTPQMSGSIKLQSRRLQI